MEILYLSDSVEKDKVILECIPMSTGNLLMSIDSETTKTIECVELSPESIKELITYLQKHVE